MSKFSPGFGITPQYNPIGFHYADDCFGPPIENRKLDSIRPSLMDPNCTGPDIVYSIAMDVGKTKHQKLLNEMHLLFGVVSFAAGSLGKEPVRSQGHIHRRSAYANNWSTPEVYEIWKGKAVVYMQESAEDNPGRCFAVYAKPGDVVIVPPSWAHATINADPNTELTFGAWCDRDYGFEYDSVRAHQGLAWYPLLNGDRIIWQRNRRYEDTELVKKEPESYASLSLNRGQPIYSQFERDPTRMVFVPKPAEAEGIWRNFVP